MSNLDLAYMPATEMTRRIRAREISPVELVANSLERIGEVNPRLNGFCFVYRDEAMAEARAIEKRILAGEDCGLLAGVPVAFKDLTPMKGRRTTLGSYAYENWIPDEDAPIVEAFVGAGAIVVGKTTTPEFAHSGFTESPLWGITRNPWNPERSAGGSSGGAGVAVATGCVPLAEGSDMGGSVRIPAALCGIAGLKPSFGRIPFTILPSQFDSLSHFGPLARTVDDTALFLSVAQGPDERDIQSLKPALDIRLPLPTSLQGYRLALSVDQGFCAVDPEVEANTRAAAAALKEAGAVVEEVELGWSAELVDAWTAHWGVYLAAFFADKMAEFRDKMDPSVVRLMDAGLAMNAVEFKRIEFLRTEQWKKLYPILEKFDALLTPTMSQGAPKVGRRDFEWSGFDEAGKFRTLDMTSVLNFVSQCPAFSVPSGFTSEGLPTALQIVGRRFDDLTALRIGKALEAVRPWADKRPPEANIRGAAIRDAAR